MLPVLIDVSKSQTNQGRAYYRYFEWNKDPQEYIDLRYVNFYEI